MTILICCAKKINTGTSEPKSRRLRWFVRRWGTFPWQRIGLSSQGNHLKQICLPSTGKRFRGWGKMLSLIETHCIHWRPCYCFSQFPSRDFDFALLHHSRRAMAELHCSFRNNRAKGRKTQTVWWNAQKKNGFIDASPACTMRIR